MGQIAIGRDSIEAMHRIVFQKVMKHAVLSQDILYMREIGLNMVFVTTKWITKGHTDDRNNELPDRKGIMQVVLTQNSGSWNISMIQNFDFTTM